MSLLYFWSTIPKCHFPQNVHNICIPWIWFSHYARSSECLRFLYTGWGELRAWKLRPLGWFYYYHQSLWEVWVHLYPYAQILVAHFPFQLSLLVHTFHFPLEQFPFWCYSKYFVLFELGILVEYFSYFDSVHKFLKLNFEQ